MTLRKKTIDNSVKYISQTDQTQNRDSKLNTIRDVSLPRKQNKIISQNKKSSLIIYKH